jgi:integrase
LAAEAAFFHYGHINHVKNADRFLQGLPGWEPIIAAPQIPPETGRDDADAAKDRAARSKKSKARSP